MLIRRLLDEGSRWHDVIGEKTVADAILDRIVHNAQRLELKGESQRRKPEKNIEEK
jgi:DNA replication protein DnaC